MTFKFSAYLQDWQSEVFFLFMLQCAVCFQTKKSLKSVLRKRDRPQIEEHFLDWLSKCPKNNFISS